MLSSPFASIRRIHHNHRDSGDHSHDQKSATDSSGTTSTASSLPSPTKTPAKSNHQFDRQLAKSTWAKIEPLVQNNWQWPNPPDHQCSIDLDRDYAERIISMPEETIDDLSSKAGMKRKREVRKQTLEEMQWNIGLQTFEQRRDAWTGAVHVFLPQDGRTKHDDVLAMQQKVSQTATRTNNDREDATNDSMVLKTGNLDPTYSDLGTALLPYHQSTLPSESLSMLQGMYNPVAERLLYKNLVVEAKTAVAPIPLMNVIRACVIGLKDSDEWPPKGASIDPLPGRTNRKKRRSKIKSLFGLKQDHDGDHEMTEARDNPGATAVQAGFQSSSQ